MSAQQLPCPTCGKLTPVSQSAYLPFCSDRCRLIDLGRWLDEEHAVPLASQDDEDQADELHADEQRDSEKRRDEVKADAAVVDPLRPPINFDEPPPERAPVRLPPGWHDV